MSDLKKTEPTDAATDFGSELIADFARAFMLMLGMGALHGEIASVPHPSYLTSFLLIWGVQALASAVRRP